MKKLIVAIAVLAMAPVAFGSVQLYLLNAADGTDKSGPIAAGGTLTLDVVADPGSDQVTGFSFALRTDTPGHLKITGRTLLSPDLTALNTDDSVVLGAANATLSPKNGKDLGIGAADGVTPMAGKETIMKLTLTALQDLGNPEVKIWVTGPGAAGKATWADPNFNTGDIPETSFSIVPEPASMLLLAAGAAFFARRRRA